MEFEWDEQKEKANLKKHKVSFVEAVESFFDENGIQLEDLEHSQHEKRYYWIGKTRSGRVLTTYYTKRGNKLRIIGAAEWRKFRRVYEAAKNE